MQNPGKPARLLRLALLLMGVRLQVCYSSWLWEFRSGGQYVFTQNGQVKQGRYEKTANDQQIVLDPASTLRRVMRILVLTDTALELEAEMAADCKTGARTMTCKLIS
jgi:hypothetical protein